MFGPTPQEMEGLCYVMPVTGHKAYIGKEEEEKPCNFLTSRVTINFSRIELIR
jgi:hypothetical protein